ncbi:caspase family protein [Variovorax paradoxus]|nr:caspase family protein [Variovorax paradoxus]MBT2303357.1 caspase family protein [Variovorax paradoxus]
MSALRAADDPADGGARVRRLLGLLALGLAVVFALSPAQAQPADKRIALVIGNARYPKVPLDNPENDARLIANNLRKLGFDVNEQLNVNVLQFRRALREFARRVQEDDAIAVLYYAGHGVQIDGRNFLLPVDINLRDQEEVKDESVDIEELFLSRIEKARSHPRIVILDACRDNPFAGKTRNIRSAGGLAEMGARGTLIAFASAPGAPAEDGPSGRNSVYTKHLATEMMVPGLEVEQMFKNVRVKVLRDTRERQLPWVNTSLTSNFSFNPVRDAQPAREQSAREQPAREAVQKPPAREPAGRRFEPNELEKQLERAQRELDAGRATVPPPIQPPAPQSPPQPAAQPAPQVAALSPPASSTTPASAARKFLDRAEVEQLLVGKTHTLKDIGAGYLMRWDMRSSGLIYYNSQSIGNASSSGSGRWELKNDGSLCARFNPVPPGRLTDARRPDDGCWHFYRDGEKLMRASATAPQAQPQAEIVKIQ